MAWKDQMGKLERFGKRTVEQAISAVTKRTSLIFLILGGKDPRAMKAGQVLYLFTIFLPQLTPHILNEPLWWPL